jgi:hypothetical protein
MHHRLPYAAAAAAITAALATPIRVTTTSRAPTVGGLRSYASQQLASPSGASTRYWYAAGYEDPPGIIPAQRYVVRPNDLATVNEAYYQTGHSPGVAAFYGSLPLSTASHTVWTWRSAHESGSTLPTGWYCYIRGNTDVQNCRTEPMMSLLYMVPGMSLGGQVPAGHQVVDLTVGHLPLVEPIPVVKASMSLSFDGGKTWQTAHITGSSGHYRAAFTAQAGRYVTIRTSARDAAGGSVTETITNAFRVAS